MRLSVLSVLALTADRVRRDSEAENAHFQSRCFGHWVRRTGRYGPFWGCSEYPRCRHTKPYEPDFDSEASR